VFTVWFSRVSDIEQFLAAHVRVKAICWFFTPVPAIFMRPESFSNPGNNDARKSRSGVANQLFRCRFMTRSLNTNAARQLFVKFPKLASGPCNVAKLEDVVCPACGFRKRFRITMITLGEVTDDESAADVGIHEWHSRSYCRCDRCNHHGKVRDFVFKGLDDLVTKRLLGDVERIAQAMTTHHLSDAAWEALPRDEKLGYLNEFSSA
jgi:hypothetical protein